MFYSTSPKVLYKVTLAHKYQKSKIDCLRFDVCPLQVPVFQGFFFFFLRWPLTVLMKQTRQAVCAFNQSILLICLCFSQTWQGIVQIQYNLWYQNNRQHFEDLENFGKISHQLLMPDGSTGP